MDISASDSAYNKAIGFLAGCLKRACHKNVIILIDEYDVPLENFYFCGFYDKMIGLIRSVFESALKTNTALEIAILTGCLRISKESIFTGLNNLNVYSVTASKCRIVLDLRSRKLKKSQKIMEFQISYRR